MSVTTPRKLAEPSQARQQPRQAQTSGWRVLDPRNFHHVFKLRANPAGVPELPAHATRKTCAS